MHDIETGERLFDVNTVTAAVTTGVNLKVCTTGNDKAGVEKKCW